MKTKKTKAIALQYEKDKDNAPKVTAKGDGVTAEKIIALAKENNIPIKEDTNLVELLSKVELDKEVPQEMYKAVAEVFSFLYKLTKEK